MRRYIVEINGDEYKVDIEKTGNGVYRVKIGDKIAQVTVKRETEKVSMKRLSKREESIIEKKGIKKVEVDSNVVTAMLPGTILKILVSVGEHVKAGQALLILEAMKMENEVVSPRDGVVKEIKVKEGEKVETGEVLMVIE